MSDANCFGVAASLGRRGTAAPAQAGPKQNAYTRGSASGAGREAVYLGNASTEPMPHGLLPQEAPHIVQPELYAQVSPDQASVYHIADCCRF